MLHGRVRIAVVKRTALHIHPCSYSNFELLAEILPQHEQV